MLTIRSLGLQPYNVIWDDMKRFTSERDENTIDEIWLLEHPPVYTQGQAGKPEHILNTNSIPIVQTDRGGQITYHGPGQLVAYVLMDIGRRQMGIRTLVCQLEQLLTLLLKNYNINAETRCGAPGVYVNDKKIASIGLRVKKGCTYHGIALNVAMDLRPFEDINPCGYAKLQMTQIQDFVPEIRVEEVSEQFTKDFLTIFGCSV
jgi:lipoyl(octanoyl) transferase